MNFLKLVLLLVVGSLSACYTNRTEDDRCIDSNNVFVVTVDYSRSFEDMVAGGKYEAIYPEVNNSVFPIKGQGKSEVRLELVQFTKDWESADEFNNKIEAIRIQEVLEEFRQHGFRPATFPELLALGEKYPDEIKKYSEIVALGSYYEREAIFSDGKLKVFPSLSSLNHRPCLSITFCDLRFRKHERFLAVREQ